MRKPSRSPARRTSGLVLRTLRASEISETGIIAAAPFARAVTMELVARSTSKTTQTVWLKSRSLRALNSAGLNKTSRVFISGPSGLCTHVVEQVLLGETGMGPKMGGCEFVDVFERRPMAREVKLPERLHDPNVHRKGCGETVGEQ